jgi:hypothetical protein
MYCMSNRTLAGLRRERPIGCVLASKERLEYGSLIRPDVKSGRRRQSTVLTHN